MVPRRLTFTGLIAILAIASAALARPQVEIDVNFRPLQTFPGDWTGYRQLVGDVNGDGRDDLIWNRTNNTTHNYTFVGLAQADGSFIQGPLSTFLGNWSYYWPYVGDFNGDGRTDLLWNSKCQDSSCAGSANYTAIGLSNGDGTFSLLPTQQLGTAGWSTYRTRIGDVDGDGDDDVVFNHVGNGFGQSAKGANYIYVATSGANANLTLGSLQTVGLTGWDYYNVTIGDVNGDSRADLVWMTICIEQYFKGGESCWVGSNNRVAVGLGGSGEFAVFPPQSFGVDGMWGGFDVYEGDVDGDDRLDFVWARSVSPDILRVFVGRSTGSGTVEMGEEQSGTATAYRSAISMNDVDGDGKDELLANTICQEHNQNYSTCIAGRNLLTIGQIEANGAVVFEPEMELAATDLETLSLQPRHLKADYNGDGVDDLLWATILPNGIWRGTANTVLVGLIEPPIFVTYIPASWGP